jgi:hypothetical protein
MPVRSSRRVQRDDTRSTLFILAVATPLIMFGFALCLLRFYETQEQLRAAVDLVAGKVLSVEEQQVAGIGPAVTSHVFEVSSVPGVFVARTMCPPGELGECNDLIIATRQGDQYFVILKSVRSLMNSLGYDTLAYPIARSEDGRRLALRLMNEDGTAREQIVLFNTVSRQVQDVSATVPLTAVASPSLSYIAYPSSEATLVVLDPATGKRKTVARLRTGETLFSLTAQPVPHIVLTDTDVSYDVYDSSPTATTSTTRETRTVKFSF